MDRLSRDEHYSGDRVDSVNASAPSNTAFALGQGEARKSSSSTSSLCQIGGVAQLSSRANTKVERQTSGARFGAAKVSMSMENWMEDGWAAFMMDDPDFFMKELRASR